MVQRYSPFQYSLLWPTISDEYKKFKISLNQEEIEESGESAENLVALEEADVDDEPVDADRDEDERHLGVNVIKLFISVIYEYS